MNLKESQINLTLCYVVNNATKNIVNGRWVDVRNPDATTAKININNRLAKSTMTKGFSVVWGPGISIDPGTALKTNIPDNSSEGYASNVVAVIVGPDKLLRVVVSGTNFDSMFDTKTEDNNVIPPQPLSQLIPGCPSDAGISPGSLAGMQNILEESSGRSLLAYLDLAAKNSKVKVVGHSLGGALATVLSLYLASKLASTTIYCDTFAGPTAGNVQFATYFDETLSDRSSLVFNSLDVIPCAWNADTFKRIHDIYDPGDGSLGKVTIKTPDKVKIFVDLFDPLLEPLNYWQPVFGAFTLTGAINANIVIKGDDNNFYAQMGYQHIYEYITLLGLNLADIVMPPPG